MNPVNVLDKIADLRNPLAELVAKVPNNLEGWKQVYKAKTKLTKEVKAELKKMAGTPTIDGGVTTWKGQLPDGKHFSLTQTKVGDNLDTFQQDAHIYKTSKYTSVKVDGELVLGQETSRWVGNHNPELKGPKHKTLRIFGPKTANASKSPFKEPVITLQKDNLHGKLEFSDVTPDFKVNQTFSIDKKPNPHAN